MKRVMDVDKAPAKLRIATRRILQTIILDMRKSPKSLRDELSFVQLDDGRLAVALKTLQALVGLYHYMTPTIVTGVTRNAWKVKKLSPSDSTLLQGLVNAASEKKADFIVGVFPSSKKGS